MNVNNLIGNSAQSDCIKQSAAEAINFPNDDLMKEVINHMPRETSKEILLNVYDRYKREFDF